MAPTGKRGMPNAPTYAPHYHNCIANYRIDRNSDIVQRYDTGTHIPLTYDNKSRQNINWQVNCHHQRRMNAEQKQRIDDGNYKEPPREPPL